MQNVMTPLSQVDSTALFALGSWAEDGIGNEYQYCKGIGSTVVGSAVAIASDYSTTLTIVASGGQIGFAMGAVLANQYGWYLRKGEGPCVNAATVVAGARLQVTATPGQVDDLAVASQYITGAYAGTVTAAGAGKV